MRSLIINDLLVRLTIFLTVIFIPQNMMGATTTHEASQILIDDQGDAVTVWINSTKSGLCIQASTCLKGKKWSKAKNVSDVVPYLANMQAQMDTSGTVIVSWSQSTNKTKTVQVYTNTLKSGKWSGPTPVSGLSEKVEGRVVSAICNGHCEILWNAYEDDDLLIHYSSETD